MSQEPQMENVIPCQLSRNGNHFIAYSRNESQAKNLPEVVFLSGLRSDMLGTKACALAKFCEERGQAFTRFDYYGHGLSSGDFMEGTIGMWLEDTLDIIDRITEGPLILVGSSLGGWLMCLAALQRPERIKGMVGIAPAPDFTEELMRASFSKQQEQELKAHGLIHLPSDNEGGDYVITSHFLDEAQEHQILHYPISIHCPVHILHGTHDKDVPWKMGQRLMDKLESEDVQLTLIKNGDHRLSSPEQLEILRNAVDTMSEKTKNVD